MTEDKVDLTPEVQAQIPNLLAQGFDAAVEGLHILERKTRIANDAKANCIVCEAIVNLCIESKRWYDLQQNVSILAKRRGYSRKSVAKMVSLTMDAIDHITDEATRTELIKTLLEVTEGKIFVEVERARLTSTLVSTLEAHGKLEEAMNLLQDLRLEVLTTMEQDERIGLMLHQFQLCLQTKDALRASLSAEKIRDQKVENPELKLQYLKLLVQYHTEFTHDFMEIADAYYNIWKIDNSDTAALMNAIISAILAPRTEKQLVFFNEVKQLRELALMPEARTLLSVFLGRDLVPYPEFEARFGHLVEEEDKKEIMRKRVIEHGLRTISQNYTRIYLERLAELLQLTVDELEERIIDLVFAEEFYARIDRPAGIVTFKKQKKVSEVADEFSMNIAQVCKLVDKANSLIEKERQFNEKAAMEN